jgi:hypothetical protein
MMGNWGLGALGGGFPAARQRFEEQYHCYSVAFAEKPHLEVRNDVVYGVYVAMESLVAVLCSNLFFHARCCCYRYLPLLLLLSFIHSFIHL